MNEMAIDLLVISETKENIQQQQQKLYEKKVNRMLPASFWIPINILLMVLLLQFFLSTAEQQQQITQNHASLEFCIAYCAAKLMS